MQTACMHDSQGRSDADTPPPLVGLGREADQGWGQGSGLPLAVGVRTPPPNLGPLRGQSPQGEGESCFSPSPRHPSPARRFQLPTLLAGRVFFSAAALLAIAATLATAAVLATAVFLATAALLSCGAAAQTPDTTKTPDTTQPILVLPPLQWDAMGVGAHIAVQRGADTLARLMGGLTFGLKPDDVGQHLPRIGGELHWKDLPTAKGFANDVRFVRMPMRDAGALRPPGTGCFGEPSDVVLLFRNGALFRVSWRFRPDRSCPSPHDAAEALYAGFVPLSSAVAISTHYSAAPVEVVDVTDPGAGPALAQHGELPSQ